MNKIEHIQAVAAAARSILDSQKFQTAIELIRRKEPEPDSLVLENDVLAVERVFRNLWRLKSQFYNKQNLIVVEKNIYIKPENKRKLQNRENS